uniref:TRAF-type domain-containing protein n=1 Tax=Macrostomum lignano TaxID=282301 RepID=A0A1I8J879_9PLAT
VKCSACGCVLESPVCLPCSGQHLVCSTCLLRKSTGRQKLFRCPSCHDRIVLDNSGEDPSLEQLLNGKGVPNWIRVELASLRLSCPKRCGSTGLRLSELGRHFGANCGKTEVACGHAGCAKVYRRELAEQHDSECPFKRVECRVCKKQMLNKDLMAHQVKARCHDLELKLARKQCMKQCNKDVLEHYRQLREHSLVTMQEFRRTELCHLERMGVQGFARRQPLPHLTAVASLNSCDAMKRCERCRRVFNCDSNHETACRWHGGGLCLACGKPSHTPGCILSAHREFLPPLLSATRRQQQHQSNRGNASSYEAASTAAPISV